MSDAPPPDAASASATDPQTVGGAFVRQYYRHMHLKPENLYKFYKAESSMVRATVNAKEDPVVGREAIKARITELELGGANVDLETAGSVDCQNSLNHGVVVLVTGHISWASVAPRRFVQTFFLAKQEGGYFVLNDAFRYLDHASNDADAAAAAEAAAAAAAEEAAAAAKAEAEAAAAKAEAQAAAAKAQAQADADAKAAAAAAAAAASAAAAAESQGAAKAAAKAASAAATEDGEAEAKADAATNGAAPAPPAPRPSSYAAAAARLAAAPPAAPAPKPPVRRAAPAASASAPAGAARASRGERGSNTTGDAPGRGLFIRVSPDASEEEIMAALSAFGPVDTLNAATQAKGFVFANMETAEGASAAVAAAKVTCHDAPMHIEERKEMGSRTGGHAHGGAGGRGGRSAGRGGSRGGRGGVVGSRGPGRDREPREGARGERGEGARDTRAGAGRGGSTSRGGRGRGEGRPAGGRGGASSGTRAPRTSGSN